MKLKNKVALVTGSGRNIGRAIALGFAREGADVVVNSRSNPTEAELVAEEARVSGVRAIATLADVSKQEQVDAMFRQALDTFGHVDILVSNAAIRPQKSFVDLSAEEWRQAIGVILDGAFYCSQAAVRSMLENQFGRVIFITGDGAYSGVTKRAHVSAAKMGLTGLARGLATEYADKNITFNIISPVAWTRLAITPSTRTLLPCRKWMIFPWAGLATRMRSPMRVSIYRQRRLPTSPGRPYTSMAGEDIIRKTARFYKGTQGRLLVDFSRVFRKKHLNLS